LAWKSGGGTAFLATPWAIVATGKAPAKAAAIIIDPTIIRFMLHPSAL
jgi:hypothetical protein